jgi:2-alkyl-3-oxoalkanoate reductase
VKIFFAGATGAIGRRLLPLLTSGGHQVIAATRTKGKFDSLRAAGAEPVVVDALDRDAVMQVIGSTRPDTIVHQMTALAGLRSLKNFDQEFAPTNRLRTEGTRHLLAAARAMGIRRFVAQSYTGWPNIRVGGRIKTEDDPLDPNPPQAARRTFDAIRQLEAMVSGPSGITGIVLRYGSFYGPGTSFAPDGDICQLVRQRRFPIFGDGAGVWSFTHIDDAAKATALAIERGPSGIFNIVDDEPAEVSVWLPELAKTLGAKPPYHLPAWIGRLMIGEAGMSIMTTARGSSNAKAKRVFGWHPMYPSWKDGFRAMMASAAPSP